MKMISTILGALFSSSLFAAPPEYAAWLPWEVDSAVTAWVLKRHVTPDANITAFPKGTELKDAQGIDTPTSPYRRTGRYTAFDAALRIHAIDTPCTRALQPLVKLLELAKWRKSTVPEAEAFEVELIPLLPTTPQGDMKPAFDYIDRFCARRGGQL